MQGGQLRFRDVTALVVVGMLGLSALFVMMGRVDARRMENSARVKGIHSACVLWSQGSNDAQYPGFKVDRTIADFMMSRSDIYGSRVNGAHPAYRYAILLNNNYFEPKFAISPLEDRPLATVGKDVTHANFSFAMLQINQADRKATPPILPFTRNSEWNCTTNSQAIVISDRNKGAGNGVTGGAGAGAAASIHGGPWAGSVCYNDNHVEFESTHILTTFYTGGVEQDDDNLFATGDTEPDTPPDATHYDAAMVFQDATTLVNQD